MSIRLEKLQDLYKSISRCGMNSEGGTTRLSWSPEFLEAQQLLADCMHQYGLTVVRDNFGNLIGTLPGKKNGAPVYSGSHLDSVPNGGSLDGFLGILGAMECVRSWHEEGWQPDRPVKIIAFAEEEGTRFGRSCLGSRAMTGELSGHNTEDFVTNDGQTLTSLLQDAKCMGNPFQKTISPDGVFVELHIEQGNYLDDAHIPVGLVSAIVGIGQFTVTLKGNSNHAGTTTMKSRHDALVTASDIISAIYQIALQSNGQFVATVGQIAVSPNAINVIPGIATFTVEVRAEHLQTIDTAIREIEEIIYTKSSAYGVKADIKMDATMQPTPMSEAILSIMKEQTEKLTIPMQTMPSWAGHDSMIMGRYMPTGMIFVRSKNGISHSPEEYSSWEDIENGVRVLDGTLRTLATETVCLDRK